MVTTYYPPRHFGGDAIFVQGLSRALVRRGHQVEVICCDDAYQLGASAQHSGQTTPTSEDAGVVLHRLQNPGGWLSPLWTQQIGTPGPKASAIREILGRPFDVVNFHNISLVAGPGVLGMSSAPVRLYTLHEHWLLCPTHIFWKNKSKACDKRDCLSCSIRSRIPPQLWRYTSLIRESLKGIQLILSPSRFTAQKHMESGIETPIRVLPTYSGLSPAMAADQMAQPTSAQGERPRFVFSGRVTASKGIHRLVETFAGLPEFDLDVIGEGDLLELLHRKYANVPSIRFRGAVPHHQMEGWYRGASALILPSLAPEVFPLCVMEAFSCGTPAIVHDAGGAGEAVRQSGAGFVYTDEAQFQNALETVAGQPLLREELGRLARDAYERVYNEDRYIDEYLGIVEGLRANPAGAPKGQVATARASQTQVGDLR
jgi:glycosyltransferase involved in cell wall biosynthesis